MLKMNRHEDGSVSVDIDKEIYSGKAINATMYKYTDKFYMNIETNSEKYCRIFFNNKMDLNIEFEINEFQNELIDQQVRVEVEEDFGEIRNKIVQKAFWPKPK